ncbi:hypothetical protein, partial [Rhodoblastus sp.]|uniref:hypothetical protein n=1 Tax=Rhodoblastus sp. TaxID=1962975 RepID=UPI003F9CEF5C
SRGARAPRSKSTIVRKPTQAALASRPRGQSRSALAARHCAALREKSVMFHFFMLTPGAQSRTFHVYRNPFMRARKLTKQTKTAAVPKRGSTVLPFAPTTMVPAPRPNIDPPAAEDARRKAYGAYLDLETPIRDAMYMAGIAAGLAHDAFDTAPGDHELLLFAVQKVSDMLDDLDKAYQANWKVALGAGMDAAS